MQGLFHVELWGTVCLRASFLLRLPFGLPIDVFGIRAGVSSRLGPRKAGSSTDHPLGTAASISFRRHEAAHS